VWHGDVPGGDNLPEAMSVAVLGVEEYFAWQGSVKRRLGVACWGWEKDRCLG
jgi:hypothetical protein